MRARNVALLVLTVSTLTAGVLGMGSATGKAELNLVLAADTQKVHEIDHKAGGLRLGDRVAARGPLTNSKGTKVGTAYGDCVVHRRIVGPNRGLWTCTYVLELGGGDLMVEGLDPRGPGAYEMAVLGGTGAFANASGDAIFTDTFDDTGTFEVTDMEIRVGT